MISSPPPPPAMDSSSSPTAITTPPSLLQSDHHHRTKPTSRLAFEDHHEITTSTPPPSRRKSPFSPSPLHLSVHNHSPIPLQDLLLSPSPHRKHKSRTLAEECLEPLAAMGSRRKSKAASLMGCASPRNVTRRARRRLEKEIAVGKEERDSGALEVDVEKPRKRKQSSKSKIGGKETLCSLLPSSSPLPSM